MDIPAKFRVFNKLTGKFQYDELSSSMYFGHYGEVYVNEQFYDIPDQLVTYINDNELLPVYTNDVVECWDKEEDHIIGTIVRSRSKFILRTKEGIILDDWESKECIRVIGYDLENY